MSGGRGVNWGLLKETARAPELAGYVGYSGKKCSVERRRGSSAPGQRGNSLSKGSRGRRKKLRSISLSQEIGKTGRGDREGLEKSRSSGTLVSF